MATKNPTSTAEQLDANAGLLRLGDGRVGDEIILFETGYLVPIRKEKFPALTTRPKGLVSKNPWFFKKLGKTTELNWLL